MPIFEIFKRIFISEGFPRIFLTSQLLYFTPVCELKLRVSVIISDSLLKREEHCVFSYKSIVFGF